MPRLRFVLPLLLILLSARALTFAQTPDEKRLAITKDVMNDFASGALSSIRERFNAELKDGVSEDDLKDAHDALLELTGAFQSHISQAAKIVQGAPVYVARSQFEHYKVELRLAFDDENQIADFRIGPVSDMAPDAMEASARTIADLLIKQRFADADAKFSRHLQESMPTFRLEASWTHVLAHLGAFKSIRSSRKDPDLDRVDVRCEFENGAMILRLAFDPDGKASALWMLPADAEKDSQI